MLSLLQTFSLTHKGDLGLLQMSDYKFCLVQAQYDIVNFTCLFISLLTKLVTPRSKSSLEKAETWNRVIWVDAFENLSFHISLSSPFFPVKGWCFSLDVCISLMMQKFLPCNTTRISPTLHSRPPELYWSQRNAGPASGGKGLYAEGAAELGNKLIDQAEEHIWYCTGWKREKSLWCGV